MKDRNLKGLERTLKGIILFARIALISTIALAALALVAYFFGEDTATILTALAGDSGVIKYISLIPGIASFLPAYRTMVLAGLFIGTQIIMLLIINSFSRLILSITAAEHPFSRQTAKKLKRYSYEFLLLCFWNVPLAVILTVITLLMSYLFEYGAVLQEKAEQTLHTQEQMIVSFAEITENKSGQTGQHIKRVSEYANILALEMGVEPDHAEMLRIAATMHDIGKLLIPSEILEKPGRLTDEEFAVIKQHPVYGGQLLNHVDGDVMHLARTVAMEHHERWDGRGYAGGMKGEEISLDGRIVAVADVYDALTSRRSYKDAWDASEARDEIVRCSGTQFDPAVVDAFVRAFDRIEETRRTYQDRAA